MTAKWYNINQLGTALVALWVAGIVAVRAAGADTCADDTVTVATVVPDTMRQMAVAIVPDAAAVRDTVYLPLDSLIACLSKAERDSLKQKLTRYERRTIRYKRFWHSLTPDQFTMQYAGSIGLISYGLGWHYGRRDRIETDFLIGHVPRYHSEHRKVTLTLKQRFVLWRIEASRRWTVDAVTSGLYVNSIFGEDFWASEPDRYPKRYYGFSTKVRIGAYVGQSFCYNIPRSKRRHSKSLSLYYELGSCDLYIISAITNREVRMKDILSLALGVKFMLF